MITEMKIECFKRCEDHSLWLRSLETDVGTIYLVEHEDEGHELKQDYLGIGDLEKAVKAFRKAFKRVVDIESEKMTFRF